MAMSESEIETIVPRAKDTTHDAEDRLTSDFVERVVEKVEQGDTAGARALVEPLHPADIADLFELARSEDRQPLATALTDLLDGDVLAEMNDWVREQLMEALAQNSILTTPSRSSRIWRRRISARCCARWSRTIAPRSKRLCLIPRRAPAA
jgi:hypothetical protein